MMTAKIYCRQRRRGACEERRPRYRVVAVSGVDLKVYASHLRLDEVRQIADEIGAELVLFGGGKGDRSHREKEA